MEKENGTMDHIEGDKIVIYDFSPKAFKILKAVEILTPQKKFQYEIKKTKNGKYMLQ